MMKDKIENVKNRIEFVQKLTEIREHFMGKDKVIYAAEEWTHPYVHFHALRNYLVLTCFDILGTNEEFILFQNWLNSNEKENERKKIFNMLPNNICNSENILKVLNEYNKIYGISQGFKRFINVIISKEDKKKLFDSIAIYKTDNNNKYLDNKPSESKKISFL